MDLTDGELDADGLFIEGNTGSWNGDPRDRAGRNPYNDLTDTFGDYNDFFKNDTDAEAIFKKDIAGNDRPMPDTADVA